MCLGVKDLIKNLHITICCQIYFGCGLRCFFPFPWLNDFGASNNIGFIIEPGDIRKCYIILIQCVNISNSIWLTAYGKDKDQNNYKSEDILLLHRYPLLSG